MVRLKYCWNAQNSKLRPKTSMDLNAEQWIPSYIIMIYDNKIVNGILVELDLCNKVMFDRFC